MPFTLAHPAAVLPLWRSRLHFPALLLGSVAPDFGYFLAGRPVSGAGHTLWGCVWLNLPLCVVFYALYRRLAAEVFWAYVPQCLRGMPRRLPVVPYGRAAWRFVLSAFLGMATHILWDGFTHKGADFVVALPVLQARAAGLPVYKWLQYGGSVFGMAAVAGFWLWWAGRFPAPHSGVCGRDKCRFWLAAAVLCLGGWGVWMGVAPSGNAAVWVIRAVDCAVLALLGMCIRKRARR